MAKPDRRKSKARVAPPDPAPQRQPPRDWKARFLKALANSANVRASCQAAGITRDCAYRARKRNKRFAAQWGEALADACDVLEAVARQRATEGGSDGLLIFLLKAHRPKKFRERIDVKHKGKGGIPLAMMGPLSVTFETVNERPLESPPEAGPAPGGA